MKLILFFVCLIAITSDVFCTMTEAQVKSAAKLMRNVCQPKSKASNAQIEAMHEGKFTQEKELLSYIECILRTGLIMKDGKLNIDALNSQLASLPASVSGPLSVSVENCKGSIKSSDKFLAAYEFYKCLYDDNPPSFFLP